LPAALWLEALQSKSSWTLVLKLIEAIQRYGKPRTIRTDNESIFTSKVFRLALFLLGIRHQRIDLHCPWQNGRVERFFGTLKGKLDQLPRIIIPEVVVREICLPVEVLPRESQREVERSGPRGIVVRYVVSERLTLVPPPHRRTSAVSNHPRCVQMIGLSSAF